MKNTYHTPYSATSFKKSEWCTLLGSPGRTLRITKLIQFVKKAEALPFIYLCTFFKINYRWKLGVIPLSYQLRQDSTWGLSSSNLNQAFIGIMLKLQSADTSVSFKSTGFMIPYLKSVFYFLKSCHKYPISHNNWLCEASKIDANQPAC